MRRAFSSQQPLFLAWSKPEYQTPEEIWLTLVGLAKYLSRTSQLVTRVQLLDKLGIRSQSLFFGFQALKYIGFKVTRVENRLQFSFVSSITNKTTTDKALETFLNAIREEQFQQEYFAKVPLSTIQTIADGIANY
ncbi:MAG: hypothetical protein HC908_02975 [Calothrix sp. SM1_7_51]|nr:hypothetical protein [Calothrix sp. SM1_7_51]